MIEDLSGKNLFFKGNSGILLMKENNEKKGRQGHYVEPRLES